MKKLILFMFTALIAVSASAQDLERSKYFDNTFIGVSTGGGTIIYTILLIINMILIAMAIRLMIRTKIIRIPYKKMGRR